MIYLTSVIWKKLQDALILDHVDLAQKRGRSYKMHEIMRSSCSLTQISYMCCVHGKILQNFVYTYKQDGQNVWSVHNSFDHIEEIRVTETYYSVCQVTSPVKYNYTQTDNRQAI